VGSFPEMHNVPLRQTATPRSFLRCVLLHTRGKKAAGNTVTCYL